MVSGKDAASWLSAQKMPRLLVEIECRAAKPQMADYHHLRAPGHRKRRLPECQELETITGSVLNIFGGKRCANSSLRWALLGPLEGVYSSRELQPSERGSGQYLTSEAFWSWVPFSCTPCGCGASGRQRIFPES